MAILTFKSVPQERYKEIRAYAIKNNIMVMLRDKTRKYLFLEMIKRDVSDFNFYDIEIVVRAPVNEKDRERASEAIKGLTRFINGQDQNLELQ